MKKYFGVLTAALLAVPAFSANPTSVIETFDRGGGGSSTMDTRAANDSIIRKMYNATASSGSGYIWGAWMSTVPTSGMIVLNGTNGGSRDCVQMAKNNFQYGNYVYTRFDTSPLAAAEETKTNPNKFNNSNGISTQAVYDLSGTGVTARLIYGYINDFATNNPQVAILLRDDQGWWESAPTSGTAVTINNPAIVRSNQFSYPLASQTWTQVSTATGGGADMDEVDASGEASLEYVTPTVGAPHLNSIMGMGWICKSTVAAGTGNAGLTTYVIGTVPPTPTGLTASVSDKVALDWADVTGTIQGYNVYRSTVSGSGYQLLNTSGPLATSAYDDTTFANNTDYYYVVTSVRDNTNGVESDPCAEVHAINKLVSAVKTWNVFK
mgnify:CR=1 FL=1